MSVFSRVLMILIAIALVPLGMVWVAKTVVNKSYTVDYSTEDGADVYRQLFGVAPPAGLKSIKPYGHAGPQATSVWLHLEGAPAALDRVHATALSVSPANFRFTMPGGVGNLNTTLLADARAAGWDQVPALVRPQYFFFLHRTPEGQWSGDIVVDRAHRQAFVRAQLVKSEAAGAGGSAS